MWPKPILVNINTKHFLQKSGPKNGDAIVNLKNWPKQTIVQEAKILPNLVTLQENEKAALWHLRAPLK
jgi:hypothetical protein